MYMLIDCKLNLYGVIFVFDDIFVILLRLVVM